METISFDLLTLACRDRYKLLAGLVIPRPIAFVTSVSRTGVVNAAPFSFFNMVSTTPPICMIGIDPRSEGGLKDTAVNIFERAAFVVNLVDEALGPQMSLCSTDYPAETSEVELAELALASSEKVDVPRLSAAPASLECKFRQKVEIAKDHFMIIGDVVQLHVRKGVIEETNLRTNLCQYRPLSRLAGNHYATLGERIVLERLSFAQRKAAESQKC